MTYRIFALFLFLSACNHKKECPSVLIKTSNKIIDIVDENPNSIHYKEPLCRFRFLERTYINFNGKCDENPHIVSFETIVNKSPYTISFVYKNTLDSTNKSLLGGSSYARLSPNDSTGLGLIPFNGNGSANWFVNVDEVKYY